MYADVVDLREFYLTPLGLTVRRLLRRHVQRIWPSVRGEKVLALGYALPLLRPLLDHSATLIAAMPAEQGVAYWPREGANISCFADTANLPLADDSIDRVIVMHGLEGALDPNAMLREIWRVMKSGGRLLMIIPNRRGLWAHSDRTPFGTGQPYSGSQVRQTLRDHGFLTEAVDHALLFPPISSRLMMSLADSFENIGKKIFLGFSGVLIVEAGKQLYAPLLTQARPSKRRLVLTLPPLPAASPAPIPT